MKYELFINSKLNMVKLSSKEVNLPKIIAVVEEETESETLPVWYHNLYSFCRISYLK